MARWTSACGGEEGVSAHADVQRAIARLVEAVRLIAVGGVDRYTAALRQLHLTVSLLGELETRGTATTTTEEDRDDIWAGKRVFPRTRTSSVPSRASSKQCALSRWEV
jgi:hypothetical protein